MTELAPKYNPSEVEDKWYAYWLDHELFKSVPDAREPYTIVIPPPNVTGVLHMGHMLNNTIQDILVRRARMMGKNALWVPGTDHASISTEVKVIESLKEQSIDKKDLGREGFLEKVWEWREEYGSRIIKQLKEMDLSLNPSADFARDMFLFSFYTRGMSLVDMAYLRKKDLANGILSYRRRKTGQQLFIKWEKPMQKIVDKYDTGNSIYLLPIIKQGSKIEERAQYIYAGHNINRNLKIIGQELGLSIPLTLYCSRHSWASIAKSKNIPLSVISEGMGHDSEATTRIYLDSLDNMAIDKANSLILKSL